MNKPFFFSLAGMMAGMLACTTTSEKTGTSSDTTAESVNADVQPVEEEMPAPDSTTVYLEGLYATSTQLPEKTFAAERLFDKDESSYWATMKGAGPDEGVMLYFQNELFVRKISLKPVTKPGFTEIKYVSVYVNGSKMGDVNFTKDIEIGKKVKSLFIRITGVEDVAANPSRFVPEYTVEQFNEELAAGIAEMEVIGENGAAYTLVPPKKVDGTVKATSILSPQLSYHPSQLFDSRREFVYAEGAPTSGENETLTFSFDKNVRMDALKVWNGFQRSEKHFKANARIKSFEFGTAGNTSVYTLTDEQDPQEIKLEKALEGTEFIFKIVSVYPGTSYKDAVLSELRFIDKDRSFVIANNEEEKNIQTLEEKAKGTVLENLLDRRVKNTMEEMTSSESSLILRSDYTFVLYDLENGENDTREVIGDGSWEIIDLQKDKAKIRVFGKFLDMSQTYNEYTGGSSSSYLKIFQDFVTVEEGSIKGEKFVRNFLRE